MPKQVFPGEAMIEGYFRGQVKQIADNCLNDLTTKEAWEKRRPELRTQFLEMVGLWPLPARTDLKATITGKVDGDGLHRREVALPVDARQPRHRELLPAQGSDKPLKKLPTVLYVYGHGNVIENKISYGSKVSYQYHPAWFATHGYACLILDTLELRRNPRRASAAPTTSANGGGTTAATPPLASNSGTPCGPSITSETRTEVDAKKIGVTGRSGGGATSWWLVAGDDRPACYAPIAGIVDLQSPTSAKGALAERLKKGVIAGHCDCMFMVNKYRWDFPMVAALGCPSPRAAGQQRCRWKSSPWQVTADWRTRSARSTPSTARRARTSSDSSNTKGPH